MSELRGDDFISIVLLLLFLLLLLLILVEQMSQLLLNNVPEITHRVTPCHTFVHLLSLKCLFTFEYSVLGGTIRGFYFFALHPVLVAVVVVIVVIVVVLKY
jgi:hypothetical protein